MVAGDVRASTSVLNDQQEARVWVPVGGGRWVGRSVGRSARSRGSWGAREWALPAGLTVTDEVFMAAPLRIADMTSGLIGGEDGRVYVYNGRRTFFGDMTGKCKSWTSPCPEEKVGFSGRVRPGSQAALRPCGSRPPWPAPSLPEPSSGQDMALGCVLKAQPPRSCPAARCWDLVPLPGSAHCARSRPCVLVPRLVSWACSSWPYLFSNLKVIF